MEDWERLFSSQLTSKYTMLTEVGLYNWFPTRHSSAIDYDIGCFLYRFGKALELDLGQYISKQIVSHADHTSGRTNIMFPSLNFKLLKAQHPIHKTDEPFTPLKYFQVVQNRFLKGNRVVNVQGETSKQNAEAHTTPQNATLAHLVTEIQSPKDLNTRIDGLLERILVQQ